MMGFSRRLSGRLVLAGFAAAMTAAGGCERSSAASEAVAESQRQLAALGANPSAAAPETQREAVYKDIISRLSSAAGQAEGPEKDAASLLLAEAHAGLGELHAARALRAKSRAMHEIRVLEAALDQRTGHAALAEALEAYDPSTEVASMRTEAAEREQELASARRAVADLESRMSGLESEEAGHKQQAAALRQDEGRLRSEAMDLAGGERLARMEQAVARQREADAAEGRASGVRAQIAHLRPSLEQAKKDVVRIERQREFLAMAMRQVESLRSVNAEQAAAARSEIVRSDERIAELVAALGSLITDEVEPAFASAVKSYGDALRAVSSVKPGQGAARTSVQLTRTRLQQCLGDAQRSRGVLHELHAIALGSLASAEPASRDGAAYDRAAAEAERAASEAYASATEAYNSAIDALGSAGARAELAERLEALTRELERLRDAVPGAAGGDDAESAPAPAAGDDEGVFDDSEEMEGDEQEEAPQ